MNPMQFSVYKGTGGKHGALQFNLAKPHFYNEDRVKDYTGDDALVSPGSNKLKPGWKAREGAIFLEIASTKNEQKNVYDWDNKIILALSVTDMGKVLRTLITGDKCEIMHDPGAKSASAGAVKKFLNFESPNGIKEGCFVSATEMSGGSKRSHRVPLTGDEVLTLRVLLTKAISEALNW